jgi:hypothetical protein
MALKALVGQSKLLLLIYVLIRLIFALTLAPMDDFAIKTSASLKAEK